MFAPTFWRRLLIAVVGCLFLSGGQLPTARAEGLLQLFNVSYAEIARKMPELAEAGYGSLWLPPPTKGSGGLSVGYDLWDPFDLGQKDQRNTVRTRYGTEADLQHMMQVAHRFGIRVYFDNIMNHRAFDIPGFNETTPTGGEGQEELYPGVVPEDFHLRVTEDGFYRKWDNTRNWQDGWQVLHLGLSDLIDFAHETPNANFGRSEGSTHPKYSFVRDLNRPEQYDRDKDGNTVYFGWLIDQARAALGANASEEALREHAKAYILANRSAYVEDIGAYLIRAARWKIDRTKADGFRLDAVKHVPDYFFGQMTGANKDDSDAGYLGGIQRQFNLTRGFSDANHRDSVFNEKRGRDDAMVFGEHLGQPPGYGGYVDAGMRLVDNDLRSVLNNNLGNPGGTLAGLDAPGAGGFSTSVGVTHANSHDSDFAAMKEMQHAHYMFREGMGLVYSDGYYKAGTLGESGGAFPRHANTHFLGQFGDPRIPNILKLHNDFARGLQQGRWSDRDYMAYERRDNRDKFGNQRNGTATEEITMVAMFNDNTAQGQARPITTSFPPGAYLYQYAEGPNGSFMGGFYKYAWELGSVVVPPGGYYVFGWRTPELSNLWPQSAITLYQTNSASGQLQEVSRITVTRRDGPDGDINFNPYGLPNRGYPAGVTPAPYSYQTTVPVIRAGNFSIVARADGSAENIWLRLNGGVDLNGTRPAGNTDPAFRDHPPGIFSDVWMGYEQPLFVERQHAEKFAAKDTTRCQIGSPGAETFIRTIGGGGTINNGPTAANNYGTDNGNQASWVYHDPDDNVGGIANPPKQFNDAGSDIVIWAKSNSVGAGFKAFVYYTVDGSFPEGAGGIGRGTTRVAELNFRHNETTADWWGSANIPKPAAGTVFSYKIGFYKTGASSVWPSGPGEVAGKKNMLTTFRVADFNPSTVSFFPHNDYARVPTLNNTNRDTWPFAMQAGLSEGFHVLRARAHLNRNPDTSAPLYQTFTQVFYYDAQTPIGNVLWPATNGDTVGGSSYEVVIRTDMTVEDVWFHIDDSEAGNDDATTRQPNGNGAGFEPFTDSNRNGIRDSNEDYVDLNANGAYDNSLAKTWGQATNVTSVNVPGQKEWRFRYNNIPANGMATITLRLHEASSIRDIDLSPAAAHVTEVERRVETKGPDQRINIAWPQRDGDRVDDNYSMKVYFTKSLANDIPDTNGNGSNTDELINRFTFYANGKAQDRTGWTVNYGDFGGGAFHELSIPLPNLYNDDPNYLHELRVVHTLTNNVQLEALRTVIANPSTKPFVRITRPTEVGSDGRPTEIVLPDGPGPDLLQYTVRVETSPSVNDLQLTGSPAIDLLQETFTDTNGNGRWDAQEPSTDKNNNNLWDGDELYTDSNGNGQWDAAEPFTDANNNGVRDTNETYTDLNGNGQWDAAEPLTDRNNNGLWDSAEAFTDLNNNGVCDAPTELFSDTNGNGVRDPAEPLNDTNGNGVWDGVKVETTGRIKTWDFPWRITAPGNYLLTATATLNGQSTSTVRNARVILRQITGTDNDPNNDDDLDGLIDNIETNKQDLPKTQAETWNNGEVHVWHASGRTLPSSPDSDGDLLPDSLEVGWRTSASPAADSNADGIPNFIGDLDPPLYAVVEHHGFVPGVGSQNQGDDRTRQAAGSVTDPARPDTDNDGILDGIEDANRNGWTDGDGKLLPTNAGRTNFATIRPNLGDWPNNTIDSFEEWDETSPTRADSDGDGLQDGWGEDKNFNGFIDGDTNKDRIYNAGEEWTETDPLNRDTDGDGLPDGWEVNNRLDPLDNGSDSMRTAAANDGNPVNGASGDPDNDGFTNAQELASGTDPQSSNTVGPVTGEGSINIGNFTQWTHSDLLVLDEYNENPSNGGADIFRSGRGDTSRDIVAFSFRDGGVSSAGGDDRLYFRIDFMDLEALAEQSEVDAYIVIDTGNPAAGEAAMPNDIEITTDMKWEVVVAAYAQNFGTIFVDRNPALNTTTKFQNPVPEGGVEDRGFGGANQAAWSSVYDAVEISIERKHLIDAGWQGNPNTLNFQVFTTRPNTQAGGTGDIPGRNDIRDTIYDDWIASDWWRDQDNIILNGKLANWFGRSGNNDRNKSAKVMLVAHGNQAIQPGSVKQALLHNGATNAADVAGFVRMVQTHRVHNAPLTLHITPTLASGLQWARSTAPNVNTNSNLWPTNSVVTTNNGIAVTNQVVVPNNDGPSFNNEIRNLVQTNRIDLVGSSFADHVPKYFLQDFNNENKALAEHFLDGIYGTNAASRQIFWPTERVLDSPTLDMIRNMGYTHVFADQMRHFVKWFGRSAALGTSGYRLNRVNGVTIIPIHDVASEYLDQVRDEGSSMPIRQLLSRRARSNVQDQVVVLWRDMGDFGNPAKANSYEANVRWLSSRPWIRVVTAQQIVDGQIQYPRQDNGQLIGTWGTEDRGTRPNLVQTAKDWVDWASGENYDHWYFGSPREAGLRNETFGTGRPFGFSGEGVARDAWLAARSTTNSTNVSGLFNLAGTVIHAAMFQTAFHNTPAGSLEKFSTGAYIYPDNATNQTLAPFARHAQSQARFANVYARVKSWAETANASTLGSEAIDVDLDGAAEYLLFNSRVFAVFEARGGRMTAAWLRDPQSKKVWQVAGNFASYSNTDNEDEGADNATAYRTSGFKDWWATGGNVASPGNSNAVNNVYTPAAVTGATGWQFTGNNGITKRITLDNAWTGNLTASYTLSGPNKLFVRFGLSPNLLDLMLRGQQGLTVEENSPTRAVLKNTSGNEEVRAWVQAPAVNHSAVDVATATTTRQRRNQAQTHQVEVELTGAGPHIITLGFDQGTDIQNPGDTVTDGIPDSWWTANNITGSERVASADRDGDGLTNMQEYVFGTAPTDPASRHRSSVEPTGNGFRFNFDTAIGRTYQPKVRRDLTSGTWENLGSPVTGDGSPKSAVDSNAANRGFYRVEVTFPQ